MWNIHRLYFSATSKLTKRVSNLLKQLTKRKKPEPVVWEPVTLLDSSELLLHAKQNLDATSFGTSLHEQVQELFLVNYEKTVAHKAAHKHQ